MTARKQLRSALTDRSPLFAGRVDRIYVTGGQNVAVPALIMSAESREFVARVFARVPRARRIAFTQRDQKMQGCDPDAFLVAMFQIWSSGNLETPLREIGKLMVDEFLLACKTGAPVQMEAIFQGIGFGEGEP